MAELPGRASAKHRPLASGRWQGLGGWWPLHERGGKAVTVAPALDGPDDAEALVDPFSDEEQRSTVDVKLGLGSLGLRWMRLRRARRRLPPWLAL
jgi:hypothetical protein